MPTCKFYHNLFRAVNLAGLPEDSAFKNIKFDKEKTLFDCL